MTISQTGSTPASDLSADAPTAPESARLWRVLAALMSRFVLLSLTFVIGLLFLRAGGSNDATARMGSLINGLTPLVDVASVALLVALIYPQGLRLRDLVGSRRAAGLKASVGREIGTILLTTLAVAVAFFVFSFIANLVVYGGAPPAGEYLMPASGLLWVQLIVLPISVGIAEELIYRGYALPRLVGLLGGRQFLAVAVQAFFFGLQHVAFFWGAPWPAALAKFLTTFLAGLVFGALYLKQRRLVPLIAAHVVLDLVGFGVPAAMMLVR